MSAGWPRRRTRRPPQSPGLRRPVPPCPGGHARRGYREAVRQSGLSCPGASSGTFQAVQAAGDALPSRPGPSGPPSRGRSAPRPAAARLRPAAWASWAAVATESAISAAITGADGRLGGWAALRPTSRLAGRWRVRGAGRRYADGHGLRTAAISVILSAYLNGRIRLPRRILTRISPLRHGAFSCPATRSHLLAAEPPTRPRHHRPWARDVADRLASGARASRTQPGRRPLITSMGAACRSHVYARPAYGDCSYRLPVIESGSPPACSPGQVPGNSAGDIHSDLSRNTERKYDKLTERNPKTWLPVLCGSVVSGAEARTRLWCDRHLARILSWRPGSPRGTAPCRPPRRRRRAATPARWHRSVSDMHLGDLAVAEDDHRDRPAGQPRSAAPDAVGDQLAEQEHHRLTRRVLLAEHRRRERAGHRDALGAPGNGHALTSRRSGHDDAIPSAATCQRRTASAAQKAASSRPAGNPARIHARSTYRPTVRVPRGRQGQHRFSTRSGNNRKQPASIGNTGTRMSR